MFKKKHIGRYISKHSNYFKKKNVHFKILLRSFIYLTQLYENKWWIVNTEGFSSICICNMIIFFSSWGCYLCIWTCSKYIHIRSFIKICMHFNNFLLLQTTIYHISTIVWINIHCIHSILYPTILSRHEYKCKKKHLHVKNIRCWKFGYKMQHNTVQERELLWSIRKGIIDTFSDDVQNFWFMLVSSSTNIRSREPRGKIFTFLQWLAWQWFVTAWWNY